MDQKKGSETVRASEAMLQRLIDTRSAKERTLNAWVGKLITVSWSAGRMGNTGLPNWTKHECHLQAVTTFYSTFSIITLGRNRSEPNKWLDLSWDDDSKRLRVFVDPEMSGL